MSLKIVRSKTLPIGVDLGSSMLKMAQFRMNEGVPELLAAGTAEIPAEIRSNFTKRTDFTIKSIRSILKSSRFTGRRCVLSLPAEVTFVHHVKVPPSGLANLAPAVQEELRGKLPYPPEEAVIRYIVAGEVHCDGESKQEVIAISAPRNRLDAYLNMAQHTKLDVVAVNVEPCAIIECFSRLFARAADATRTTMFLDLGVQSTQVVLTHGSHIVFARNLVVAGKQLDQAVADGMHISVGEAGALRRNLSQEGCDRGQAEEVYGLLETPLHVLSEELTQCLRYYESVFRNQSVERAIFLGGQAHDKRLCQVIAKRLNLPAQVGDPMLGVKRTANAGNVDVLASNQPQPDWAVAIGLSLGANKAA